MNTYKTLYLAALLNLVALSGFSTLTHAAPTPGGSNSSPDVKMYRYVNDKGTTVTSYQIPPQYAKKGYKIVSPSGTVLEEVAPELSEEERKRQSADQLSQVEQREKDKQLLLRYSQVGELIQARDRTLGELENKIKGEEANLSAIHNQITAEQEKAALAERSGKQVPDAILKKLKSLYHDQEIAEEHIVLFRESYNKDSKEFEEDIKRYEFLNNQRLKKQALPQPPEGSSH